MGDLLKLLPDLLKMAEDRLGRFGAGLVATTLTLLIVAACVFALHYIWKEGISPVLNSMQTRTNMAASATNTPAEEVASVPKPALTVPPAIAWDAMPVISYDSPDGQSYHADQFIVRGRNASDHEVSLQGAYIVSGITGEKREMFIEAFGGKNVPVGHVNAIPPGASISLEADFIGAAKTGLSESEFRAKWGRIIFVVRYDGKVERRTFDDAVIAAAFSALYGPSPLPHITTK